MARPGTQLADCNLLLHPFLESQPMIHRTLTGAVLVAAAMGSICGFAWMSEHFSDRQSTAGQTMDDRTITSRVKERIEQDRSIDAKRLNVETLNGTVQLSGFLTTQAERARAVKIAHDVPDVK